MVRKKIRQFVNNRTLLILTGIGLLLRLVLIARGGQFFFRDEVRYLRGAYFISDLVLKRQPQLAFDNFFVGDSAHIGYALISVPLGTVHGLIAYLANANTQDFALWIPAVLQVGASVALLPLIYSLAKRAGASETESLLAAFFGLCANSLFYFSRHLLPYDISLALILWGLWLGLGQKRTPKRSLLVGFVLGSGIFTYYGYWMLGGLVIAVYLLYDAESTFSTISINWLTEKVKHGLTAAAMLPVWPLLVSLVSLATGNGFFFSEISRFAATISQGDPAEGWRLIWEYLWYGESLVLLIWLAGIGLLGWALLTRRLPLKSRHGLWLFCTLGIYLLMAITSTGLGWFVMYGRLARQMVPFLCLAAAGGYSTIAQSKLTLRYTPTVIALALTAAVAFYNELQPILLTFPIDVVRQVEARYGPVKRTYTIETVVHQFSDPEDSDPPSDYTLVNAGYYYPVISAQSPQFNENAIIMRVNHPMSYRPFLYEGYTPEERALLLENDIAIYLIRTP